ncbi:MAG: hypothetical protein E7159_05915 [Firmicutes bacterium]|nr:hypothetical protein [Bacillota bacterium]
MYMQLSDKVQNILVELMNYNNENPYQQHLPSQELSKNDAYLLEMAIPEIIPNIIVTHSLTDTEEDLKQQNLRRNELNSMNMYPYYIDIKVKAKKRARLQTV